MYSNKIKYKKISILLALFLCFLVIPLFFIKPYNNSSAETSYRFSSQTFSFSVLPLDYEINNNNKITSLSSGAYITSLSCNFNLISNGGGVSDGYLSLNTSTSMINIRSKTLTDFYVTDLDYNDDFYFLGARSPYDNGVSYLGYSDIYSQHSLDSFSQVDYISDLSSNRWHTLIFTNGEYEDNTAIIFCYYCQSNFNGNVTSYTTGNRAVKCYDEDYYNLFNFITFYDSNGKYCSFQFLTSIISRPDYTNDFSPLFLLDNRSFSIYGDLNNNDFYNLGYNDGYQNGYNIGSSSLDTDTYYNNGFSVGQTYGYNLGYSAGVNDSNQYSFGNLLFSVLDTPVKVLQSVLNFDILGMNMLNLFYGLVTCALVFFIVRNLINRS